MQLGVSTYSFGRLIRSGEMTLMDVITKVKEMGFEVIEFTTLTGFLPEGETAESFAPRIREQCDAVGLPIVNYTIAADFINANDGDWEAEVERLKKELHIAKILGVPGMRHDATQGYQSAYRGPKSFDDALDVLSKGCRAVTEFAADLGIKTMVENHGFFCQDSERVEKLICAVNHPNFGALVDMGNFLCVDEDPPKAVGRLTPYVFHAHAKDFHIRSGADSHPGGGWITTRGGNFIRGSIIGHGNVQVAQCIRVLQMAGFDGVLSIEFEGLEDPITGITMGLANLRRLVDEARIP